MSGDLLPFNYSGSSMRRSESRQVTRALGHIHARGVVDAARIEQAAETQALRIDSIAYVARRGLQSAAMLSQLEASLATMVPHASGRLAVLGDLAALAIADVVGDTARRVR